MRRSDEKPLGEDPQIQDSASQNHALNMIMIEGREYLADTGYAAPLLEPIPRDLAADYETILGRDSYVLKP